MTDSPYTYSKYHRRSTRRQTTRKPRTCSARSAWSRACTTTDILWCPRRTTAPLALPTPVWTGGDMFSRRRSHIRSPNRKGLLFGLVMMWSPHELGRENLKLPDNFIEPSESLCIRCLGRPIFEGRISLNDFSRSGRSGRESQTYWLEPNKVQVHYTWGTPSSVYVLNRSTALTWVSDWLIKPYFA